MQSERFRKVTLTTQDLEALTIQETAPTIDALHHLTQQAQQGEKAGVLGNCTPTAAPNELPPVAGLLETITWLHEKKRGYDVTSLDLISGDLRLIEVKGLSAATGTILLTPNERRVAEDRTAQIWIFSEGCVSTTIPNLISSKMRTASLCACGRSRQTHDAQR